jgi:hypothetical protein
MAEACGISYEEAFAAGVEHRQISDVTIPIAKKEVLIRTKNTIRNSDKSDVGFLRGLIEEERLKEKL